MYLRISSDGDVERRDFLQARDQVRSVAISLRMGLVLRSCLRRVTAERDDVANAQLPIFTRNLVDLVAARRDSANMRGGRERRFLEDALDSRVGSLARRSARAIRDRHKARLQGLESLDRIPQRLLHLLRLRREEFEADLDIAAHFRE